jgi:hypothetical protein
VTTLLTESELRAELPAFAGTTLAAQLSAGRSEAAARLGKYTTTLRFAPQAAADLLHEIQAWQDRNHALLEAYMSDPQSDTLPEQVALEFGPEKAQALIIAGFSEAARGLGPWLSGDLQRHLGTDPAIPEPWVREDAHHRLQVFGAIVKMDDDGDLKKIFQPELSAPGAGPISGLGLLPAVVTAVGAKWLIVALILTVISTVALFLLYTFSLEQLRLNNRIMAERCERAQATGDTETVRLCIEAAAAAGQQTPLGQLPRLLLRYALIGGAIYLGATVVLPAAVKALKARPREAARVS